MAAIDDATAQRIEMALCEGGLLREPCLAGEAAKVIQDAAEPLRQPGLYFVRHGSMLHMAGVFKATNKSLGEVVSGPHTCEELLEAVKKP